MKIEINILDELNVNGKLATINIIGENFRYAAIDEWHYGIQSQFSQINKEKNQKLLDECIKIENAVRTMIDEGLL